jgi:ATP-dependent Clp protease adaptor protein ClpS
VSPAKTAAASQVEETTSDETELDAGWKTILFNCRCHTFDEVERQLIKAVRCTLSQARRWSTEVDAKGFAVVYEGARERCEAAASVLAEIGLVVRVEK